MDPIERLRFLASLPCAGAGHEKTQPFNWIPSHRVIPDRIRDTGQRCQLMRKISCMRRKKFRFWITTIYVFQVANDVSNWCVEMSKSCRGCLYYITVNYRWKGREQAVYDRDEQRWWDSWFRRDILEVDTHLVRESRTEGCFSWNLLMDCYRGS